MVSQRVPDRERQAAGIIAAGGNACTKTYVESGKG